ncbi:MAG: hypothetical protein PHT02_01035 [Tissierellia bacterium]|nr:hypothetical protein [Tissierellia bacterium]
MKNNKSEEFINKLSSFANKLDKENIIGMDKLILINAYSLNLANEYKLKII